MAADPAIPPAARLDRSIDDFEEEFARESRIEAQRRRDLRMRAANRSRARNIVKGEQRGRVRFGVLFLCLTATVITVVVVMFETLAWLVGG
ncbi:MAG: hypothetical protein U0R24_14255 [Solirubrobacterales bacterium]